MQIKANSVDYLSKLPDDRREMIEALRKVILKNIDKPFEEGLQYGMVGYYLPHSVYPDGYHCDPEKPLPFASIGSQKNNISLYLFCVYLNPEIQAWFVEEWKKTGKRLDMGKSCIRIKKLEDIPLPLIGKLFKRIKAKAFIKSYEAGRTKPKTSKPTKKKPTKKTTKNQPIKKVATKKTAKNQPIKKVATKKKSPSTKRTRDRLQN